MLKCNHWKMSMVSMVKVEVLQYNIAIFFSNSTFGRLFLREWALTYFIDRFCANYLSKRSLHSRCCSAIKVLISFRFSSKLIMKSVHCFYFGYVDELSIYKYFLTYWQLSLKSLFYYKTRCVVKWFFDETNCFRGELLFNSWEVELLLANVVVVSLIFVVAVVESLRFSRLNVNDFLWCGNWSVEDWALHFQVATRVLNSIWVVHGVVNCIFTIFFSHSQRNHYPISCSENILLLLNNHWLFRMDIENRFHIMEELLSKEKEIEIIFVTVV